MSFALFDFNELIHNNLMERRGRTNGEVLDDLRNHLNELEFPNYLLQYIRHDGQTREADICFHSPSLFGGRNSSYTEEEKRKIERTKSVFGNTQRGERPNARHHLRIFYNEYGGARLFYKINSGSIKFMINQG
jgi:hypothetical protein